MVVVAEGDCVFLCFAGGHGDNQASRVGAPAYGHCAKDLHSSDEKVTIQTVSASYNLA